MNGIFQICFINLHLKIKVFDMISEITKINGNVPIEIHTHKNAEADSHKIEMRIAIFFYLNVFQDPKIKLLVKV